MALGLSSTWHCSGTAGVEEGAPPAQRKLLQAVINSFWVLLLSPANAEREQPAQSCAQGNQRGISVRDTKARFNVITSAIRTSMSLESLHPVYPCSGNTEVFAEFGLLLVLN